MIADLLLSGERSVANNLTTLEKSNEEPQSDVLSIGDFMSAGGQPQENDSLTYEQFMGDTSSPAVPYSPVVPTASTEHKSNFLKFMSDAAMSGYLSGASSFNKFLGSIWQVTPPGMIMHSFFPSVEKGFEDTYINPAQQESIELRKENQSKSLAKQMVFDTIGSFANLAVTLPVDAITGEASKIALAGKVLPEVEKVLSAIPDFALGSGFRGMVEGVQKSKNPVEGVYKGITGGLESVAQNTMFANAGVGLKGIGAMAALSTASAVYEAAKEGRPPTRDELISGAGQGVAYGIVFSILPFI
jgi:hypothetical protein